MPPALIQQKGRTTRNTNKPRRLPVSPTGGGLWRWLSIKAGLSSVLLNEARFTRACSATGILGHAISLLSHMRETAAFAFGGNREN